MDYVSIVQKKIDAFFSKKSSEKKRSLKLIISFSEKYPGKLRYELWSTNNEFIENVSLKNILNLNVGELAILSIKGVTAEKMEQSIKKWFEKQADQLGIKKEQMAGLLKLNGEYALLKDRMYLKELSINEII